MVITGEKRLGPDIWPEIPNQSTGTEDIIFTTYYKEAIKQTEIKHKQHHLQSPSIKEVC